MKRLFWILLLIAQSAHAAPPRLPITKESASNVSIDGKANINPFPWDYANSHGVKPDPHGPDTKQVANGLILTGEEVDSDEIIANQVAGTAVAQAGNGSSLSRVWVRSAINGLNITATDAHTNNVNIKNIVKDSVTVSGGGNNYLDVFHVWGGDRGYLFSSRVIAHSTFADNERCGYVFDAGSDGSQVEMNIRDCWEWGAQVKTNGNRISIIGKVPDAKPEHPNPVGLELWPNTCHETITGFVMVGKGGKGFIGRGARQWIETQGGGWNDPEPDATYLKLDGPITKSTFRIRAYCNGGTVVDASTAQLDATDTIEEWVDGSAARIVGDTGQATVIIHEVAK